MARYAGDPRWITARFDSRCKQCGADIRKGGRLLYYPNGKAAYCEPCGEPRSREFAAAAADEAFLAA